MLLETRHWAETIGVILERHLFSHVDGALEASRYHGISLAQHPILCDQSSLQKTKRKKISEPSKRIKYKLLTQYTFNTSHNNAITFSLSLRLRNLCFSFSSCFFNSNSFLLTFSLKRFNFRCCLFFSVSACSISSESGPGIWDYQTSKHRWKLIDNKTFSSRYIN